MANQTSRSKSTPENKKPKAPNQEADRSYSPSRQSDDSKIEAENQPADTNVNASHQAQERNSNTSSRRNIEGI